VVCFDWVVPVRPDPCLRPLDLKQIGRTRSEDTLLVSGQIWALDLRSNEAEERGGEMLYQS
jgi:hypothetical protein